MIKILAATFILILPHVFAQHPQTSKMAILKKKVTPLEEKKFKRLAKITYEQEVKGRYKAAISAMLDIIKIDPKNEFNFFRIAGLYGKDQNFIEELNWVNKAIALKPDFIDAYINKGNALVKMNKLNQAESAYKKAIELDPNYANAHYSLGLLFETKRDFKESLKHYQKSLKLNPMCEHCIFNTAMAQANLGRLKKAKKHLEKLISMNPKDKHAKSMLEMIKKDIKKKGKKEINP